MRIDFSDNSARDPELTRETMLHQILREKAELAALEALFKPKKDDEDKKKDEKKGLTKKQVFWLMLVGAIPIGWVTSTILVMSILGMKANIDLLIKNFN